MNEMKYDIAVIGGGPAGMMAAIGSAENGARVVLLEKNRNCGKKLLITGKGRCNITNSIADADDFIRHFGKKGRFLYPAIHCFSIPDTIDFFNRIGLSTVTERGNRVFPASGKSADVLQVLIDQLKALKVAIKTGVSVKDIELEGNSISSITTDEGAISADSYILATGGCSYGSTGSTGDGYTWAEKSGHTIIEPVPSLVPVHVKEKWPYTLSGLILKNVSVSLMSEGKKISEGFGEVNFYKDEIGGPVILDLSREVEKQGRDRNVELRIDLKPALTDKVLDERILRDFNINRNRLFKDSLGKLLPAQLIPVILKKSGIDGEKKINSITKEERKRLLLLMKGLPMELKGIAGFNRAIITAGGVDLKEIDQRSMRSKIVDNLFFAGEVIDIDGPTGGYNLQVCWSTGFLAGFSAAG